ncbi:MAG TPA: Fis family transcriptional regulator, partial [Myxococcales bacterium]|nr:Fis family transcriptional regulator [Myxococcales bacterium]
MRAVPICVSTAVLQDDGRMVGGVEIFRDVSDVESLRQELSGQKGFADIIGTSAPMQAVFRILPDVAASDASVLIE